MTSSELKVMIEDHWDYVGGMLAAHGEDEKTLQKLRYCYTTAFHHGYKHAIEEINNEYKLQLPTI